MDVHAASHFFLFGPVNMMSTKVASLPVLKDIEFKQIIMKIKQTYCGRLKGVHQHVF